MDSKMSFNYFFFMVIVRNKYIDECKRKKNVLHISMELHIVALYI